MTICSSLEADSDAVYFAVQNAAEAIVEYIARLNEIADLRTLGLGAPGFDFAVAVPHTEVMRMTYRLADLTFVIEDRYGVQITTIAVPASPPDQCAETTSAS